LWVEIFVSTSRNTRRSKAYKRSTKYPLFARVYCVPDTHCPSKGRIALDCFQACLCLGNDPNKSKFQGSSPLYFSPFDSALQREDADFAKIFEPVLEIHYVIRLAAVSTAYHMKRKKRKMRHASADHLLLQLGSLCSGD
jgi:hypothetical protein